MFGKVSIYKLVLWGTGVESILGMKRCVGDSLLISDIAKVVIIIEGKSPSPELVFWG